MKPCPSCSSSNADEGSFCTECGAPLAGSGAERRRSSEPSPGMVIDGKYTIERVIGEGAMGIVYLARDVLTDTHVVVKAIRSELAEGAEFRARAIEEGRVLARIDHPHVVRLNALVVEGAELYLVMQFIEGNSLDRLIEGYRSQGKTVPFDEALRIFRMILQGVAAVHHQGVVHRDLKPANILVRAKDGVVKVSDFGIAKAAERLRTGALKTLGILGSPAYMAPEQRVGAPDLDQRADIYALGIVFYELLTGRVPFEAATEGELLRLHGEAPFPSVRLERPEVPPALDAILARACAKDRRDRFSTCEELEAALLQAGIRTARSVPPTVASTQGLPSVPPPSPARIHSEQRAAAGVPRTLVDTPLVPPMMLPQKTRPSWITLLLWVGIPLLLAIVGTAGLFAAGMFDDSSPALVEPPALRDAGAQTKAVLGAARPDAAKRAP